MLEISVNNSRYSNFLLYLLAMPPSLFNNIFANVSYIAYVFAFNSALLYAVYYEICGRIRNASATGYDTSKISGNLATILLIFANLSVTFSIVLNGRRRIDEKMMEFEECVADYKKSTCRNDKIKIVALLVIHAFYLGTVLDEFFIRSESASGSITHYHIWDSLLRYRLNVFVVCVYFFVDEVYMRIRHVNRILRRIIERLGQKSSNKTFSIANSTLYLCQIPDTTRNASKAYGIVLEVVAIFNRIFGWLLLILMINYLLVCIIAFSLILQTRVVEEINLMNTIWLLSLILSAVIGASAVSSICNKTTREAKKTANISYSLLLNLNTKREFGNEKSLIENLILLIRQTTSYYPEFTAAGFFTIDYSGLFTLMNLLTSYVIVLIQFA